MTGKFTGIIPPVISPLTPAGEIDVAGLESHVHRLIDGGVHGLFVLGSSGEGPLLTSSLAKTLIRRTVEAVDGQIPVIAGALEPSTVRTIEAIELAAECGADAVVITTPYYVETDDAGLRAHVREAAERSPLPVVLYNIPSKTHHNMTPSIVADVIDLENIVGIKDSHGDWPQFEQLLALRGPDFVVLQGAERYAAQSLLAGADGLVPGLSNVAPRLFAEMFDAAQAGDRERLLALQSDADALGTLHTYGHWLACLKYAVSLVGPTQPHTFARVVPLSDAARATIESLVRRQQGGPE
ncbi:MAG: dihydrodipicolinate synthase family protein [Chloroflexi bacterium]|nr:dihydrodipicolinate synthase family protein [Chloroflexota bacterium]